MTKMRPARDFQDYGGVNKPTRRPIFPLGGARGPAGVVEGGRVLPVKSSGASLRLGLGSHALQVGPKPSRTHGLSQRAFNIPPVSNSQVHNHVRHTSFPGSGHQGPRITAPGRPAVGCLLSPGGPPTVPGFIVPGAVDPVKGGTGGPDAHVRQERLERKPLRRNSYTPTTVVFPSRVFRVEAARLHGLPGQVCG